MKKQKLITTLLISAFALSTLGSCKKDSVIIPDPNATSSPIIYGDGYFEMYQDGVRWYAGRQDVLFREFQPGWSTIFPTNKHATFRSDLSNDIDPIQQTFEMSFALNQAVEPGVYEYSSGELNQLEARLLRRTSITGEKVNAEFNANKGDVMTITIDSVYKQKQVIILFGTLEGTITKSSSDEKIIINNTKFGHKLL